MTWDMRKCCWDMLSLEIVRCKALLLEDRKLEKQVVGKRYDRKVAVITVQKVFFGTSQDRASCGNMSPDKSSEKLPFVFVALKCVWEIQTWPSFLSQIFHQF